LCIQLFMNVNMNKMSCLFIELFMNKMINNMFLLLLICWWTSWKILRCGVPKKRYVSKRSLNTRWRVRYGICDGEKRVCMKRCCEMNDIYIVFVHRCVHNHEKNEIQIDHLWEWKSKFVKCHWKWALRILMRLS